MALSSFRIQMSSQNELLRHFSQQNRQALAQILTLVERGESLTLPASEQSRALRESAPLVIGITGSGGAGKSTLLGALIPRLREQGKTVAVLACDPQSPLTGGALLGDRVRVPLDPQDDGVFFRSLSTRGAQGGVSEATGQAIEWLKAFPFDVILVETVGVGQDQVAVRALVDKLVLLVTPGTGDEIQWEKAGLIEVADLVVVNKCDLPGADKVLAQLTSALSLAPGSDPPPILGISAASGQGVDQLCNELAK